VLIYLFHLVLRLPRPPRPTYLNLSEPSTPSSTTCASSGAPRVVLDPVNSPASFSGEPPSSPTYSSNFNPATPIANVYSNSNFGFDSYFKSATKSYGNDYFSTSLAPTTNNLNDASLNYALPTASELRLTINTIGTTGTTNSFYGGGVNLSPEIGMFPNPPTTPVPVPALTLEKAFGGPVREAGGSASFNNAGSTAVNGNAAGAGRVDQYGMRMFSPPMMINTVLANSLAHSSDIPGSAHLNVERNCYVLPLLLQLGPQRQDLGGDAGPGPNGYLDVQRTAANDDPAVPSSPTSPTKLSPDERLRAYAASHAKNHTMNSIVASAQAEVNQHAPASPMSSSSDRGGSRLKAKIGKPQPIAAGI
jgi:hypothetical protein